MGRQMILLLWSSGSSDGAGMWMDTVVVVVSCIGGFGGLMVDALPIGIGCRDRFPSSSLP